MTPDSKSPIVLVAEDEAMGRELSVSELQDAGYTVIEAADAHQALAILENGVPVDVLFTDVNMPGEIDGMVLARMAQRRPDHHLGKDRHRRGRTAGRWPFHPQALPVERNEPDGRTDRRAALSVAAALGTFAPHPTLRFRGEVVGERLVPVLMTAVLAAAFASRTTA